MSGACEPAAQDLREISQVFGLVECTQTFLLQFGQVSSALSLSPFTPLSSWTKLFTV